MMLAHVLTLVDPQVFYNGYHLDLQAVLKLLGKKLSERYPRPLAELTFACLDAYPVHRPSFKDIQTRYGVFFSDKYFVNLVSR